MYSHPSLAPHALLKQNQKRFSLPFSTFAMLYSVCYVVCVYTHLLIHRIVLNDLHFTFWCYRILKVVQFFKVIAHSSFARPRFVLIGESLEFSNTFAMPSPISTKTFLSHFSWMKTCFLRLYPLYT